MYSDYYIKESKVESEDSPSKSPLKSKILKSVSMQPPDVDQDHEKFEEQPFGFTRKHESRNTFRTENCPIKSEMDPNERDGYGVSKDKPKMGNSSILNCP
mmetsp:Transcript_1177/g.1179  ORF Transcript_1177/g.1179 Transcript_1177/m.1179 type:complete len:100 (+) Transcript_1177:392-691(+)